MTKIKNQSSDLPSYRYTSEEVAQYISLYAEMQVTANSLIGLKLNLNPSEDIGGTVAYTARRLRAQTEVFKITVPESIREKINVGRTPDQLESLATNTLLEFGK